MLSLQQTVSLLQRDLEAMEEKENGVAQSKPTEHKPTSSHINFETNAPERHEYPPESPSDTESESSRISVHSGSDSNSESSDDEKEFSDTRAARAAVTIVSSAPRITPPSSALAPAPTKVSSSLAFDASTDIFAMMAVSAGVFFLYACNSLTSHVL